MPYPSLFWMSGLAEKMSEATEEKNERETEEKLHGVSCAMEDLGLHAVLRPRTCAVLEKSCTAEEIPMRQKVLSAVFGRTDFQRALDSIRTDIEELGRIVGQMQRAADEGERMLWFQSAAALFFRLADAWQIFAGEENRLGEVAASFRDALQNEIIRTGRAELVILQKRRPTGLQLTIHGIQMYGSPSGALLQDAWKTMFRSMGMEEAVPPEKYAVTAAPEVLHAYTSVYPSYVAELSRLYVSCGRALFSGTWDVRILPAYADEITCLLDLTAYFSDLSAHGYPLTYPVVTKEHMVELEGVRDPTLFQKKVDGTDVVPNDIRMFCTEREEKTNFFLLTGANGGGKTTFLRACALAVLFFIKGCPIVAERGRLYPFKDLYTHFPAEERFENSGRFAEEAARAEEIRRSSDADTFAVFNETFSGTDEEKSAACSAALAQDLYDRGVFGLYVTHLHALTGQRIPTLAALVDTADTRHRTYKIRRVTGTDCSYAADILEKYHLDRASLQERLRMEKTSMKGENHV